jgi:hypothetical protein
MPMPNGKRKNTRRFLLLFGFSISLLIPFLNQETANAEWSADPGASMPICNAAGLQYGPKLIKVADGYIVFWQDQRRGSGYTDIYAQKFDVDGNILWQDNGRVVAQALTNSLEYLSQVNPLAAPDEEGGAIVGWTDVNGGNIYDSNSWATRVSDDSAVNWGGPGISIQGSDTAVLVHGGLHDITGVVGLAPDGEGGVFVSYSWGAWGSWEIRRYDANGILRSSSGYVADRGGSMKMMYGGSSQGKDSVIVAWIGGAGWGPLYIAKFEDPETQYPGNPDTMSSLWGSIQLSPWVAVGGVFGLISDGQGGAIITWNDERNGAYNADVFAQKIDANGSLAWTSEDVAVAVQPGGQQRPQVVSDGAGGAIIVWDDYRAATIQVYAQHIDQDGNFDWATNGIPISSIRGAVPKIIQADEGKYLVVWVDNDANGGTPDYLRAQKIDDTGYLYWPSEGSIIGNIYTTEFEIASDDSRGAVVIWSLGDGDIYAKRLTPAIGFSPAAFSFLGDYEGDNPRGQTLTISNTGYDTLDWSVESDATWLILSPTTGSDSGTVTVSVDISGLLPGTYNGSVTITGAGASNSPVVVPVTLTISQPSRIILLAPAEGEIIPSGSDYRIRWIGPEEAVKFKLKYSLDNGTTWKAMHTEQYVTGTEYLWEVPRPPGNKKSCLVKIIGYSVADARIGAVESSPFTIEVIRLISPNGGEILRSGEAYRITWATHETKSPVTKVNLYYTKDGGTTWLSIKSTPPENLGEYEWTPVTGKTKSRCKVKVVLKDAANVTVGSDVSDGVSTVQPPSP